MIREAAEGDIPAILDMSRRFYETLSYSKFAVMDDTASLLFIRTAMDSGTMLVAERDGRLAGMVCVFVAPFGFNHAVKTAHEVAWWVEPEYRGTLVANSLIKGMEKACRAKGVAAIQMMTMASSPAVAGELYERRGYHRTETMYTKVLGTEA